MEGRLLVVEDDAENDPYDDVGPSNESTQTASPLSFQTFGGHDSPQVQNLSGTASNRKNVDQLPIPDNTNPTRPSLDSFQSSSPSTAPPTTPTRLDGSESAVGNTSPTSPLAMSDPPTTPEPTSPRLLNNPVEKPRTLRSRREFRMFDKPANMDFQSNTSGTEVPTATGGTQPAAPPQESGGTLRRTNQNKRKPRPKLGVATFASSNGTNPAGVAIIEPSPLSPVIASPRSNRTAGPPVTPSISYIPQSRTPHTMDGITTTEPMSPDVTLDLPSSQYIFIPGTNSPDPSALVSPFGTSFITESTSATGRNGGVDSQPNKEPESAKGGGKLQYKPRRRIPTPRRRSIMAERPSLTGSADAHISGSYRMNGSITDVMGARENAPASASHKQDRAMGAPEAEGNGRRPSLSRWSFGNPDGGIGKGMMKRLSRLRSNSDLRPGGIDSHSPKSATHPKLPHSSAFSSQDGTEYRGYASEGVPTADAPQGRRRSSGMGARLSKILPLPFPARRQSTQHQQQNGSASGHGHIHDEDDTSAHLWATALSHSSILPGRPTRLSGAGSARGSASADGAHRHSTITVRSSDGWFTTMPAASASLSAPGNASPTAVHFTTIGHDISRQNSPSSLNPSRTSLTPAVLPHAPFHSTSDPTTSTLGSLSTGNNAGTEGSTSRRHSEQTASIPALDLLKPPSQRGSLSSAHTARARPQSLQHAIVANGSSLPESQAKAELLNGIQHGPDSVRLLDVETAAAIRRSIDFEDRVRKGENVLRRALYGSESGASPSTSSRASSFSTASGGRGRGHTTKGAERSSSMSGRGAGSIVPGTRQSASVDHVGVGKNGLLTGGGVFLPGAVTRSPATRYTNLNGSFHSTSSSGLSTPFHSHEINGSGILRSGLNSASGTLTRGSSTLREGQEETFGVGGASEKYGSGAESGMVSKSVQMQHSPTLAKRVGRRISRIFVGKGTSAQGH